MDNLVKYKQPESFALFHNKAMCIYDESTGFLKGNQITIELSYNKNHFWGLNANYKENGQWVDKVEYKMTNEGYDFINKYLGLKFIAPPTFKLNGVEYTNPYIHHDEYGNKDKVMYKVSVAGRDASGHINITPPVVITYSDHDSMMAAFSNKIKKQAYSSSTKDKTSKLGFACPLRSKDKYLEKNDFADYFPMDGRNGLIIDTSHQSYIEIMDTLLKKRDNIERTIVTVAKRNAIRRHPAVSIYSLDVKRKVDKNGNLLDLVSYVDVMQWVAGTDAEMEAAISNFDDTDQVPVDYTTVEAYDDIDDTQNNTEYDEAVVIIDAEDITDEVVADDDPLDDNREKNGLMNWIKDNKDCLGKGELVANFGKSKDRTIAELQAMKTFIMMRKEEQDEYNENNPE